jgi:hypothetical protein
MCELALCVSLIRKRLQAIDGLISPTVNSAVHLISRSQSGDPASIRSAIVEGISRTSDFKLFARPIRIAEAWHELSSNMTANMLHFPVRQGRPGSVYRPRLRTGRCKVRHYGAK